ncbi:hypothetical protein TanjilG_00945 [Lupinus angustifolius]|uniref:Man1/Src1-like C-terminal domain-containing protein n=1 Tax=Lupinus angustifolius TaxID=3871 RepID=A0A4P1QR70_LUPAN|nr:hypothetical protein TanjilG_00945 [Lupinus angustifolius]
MDPRQNLLPSKHDLPRLVAVITVASVVAWTCNLFFVHPPTIPFCHSSHDLFASDSCLPCPSNGECVDGNLQCLQGYRKNGNLCVEDGEISQLAQNIVERAESHICSEYAQFSCYGTGSIWVSSVTFNPLIVQEDEFWNHFESMANAGYENALYNYTKQRAVETIGKLLETRLNAHGMKEFKCPDFMAEHYKPYACRIHQWISQNILLLLPICAMIKQLAGCTTLILKVCQKRRVSRRVEELYNQVCEILEENALTSKSVNSECESWVVASRLRDHLLLPRERKDPLLWKKVEELVQEDSRVDIYPKLVKGESRVVWEWQVEGSLSASKMKKKIHASKTMVNESVALNHQRHPTKKEEPKEPLFDR